MNPRLIKALTDPYFFCLCILNRVGRLIDAEDFVRWKYYLTCHKKLNLAHPQTFNEKLQWLKLYNRNPLYTRMVDKCEAKKYVADIIGDAQSVWTRLVPMFPNVWDSDLKLTEASLRASFVVPAICFAVVLVYSLLFRARKRA